MRKINYKTYTKPSHFVKFDQGDTRVLIISDGVLIWEHGIMSGGKFVPLGSCTETIDCEQCKKGNNPKLRYKWIVYLPEIDEVRVLSVGSQIGDEVCVIGKLISKENEKSGKENKSFEVIVTRKGEGLKTRYRVRRAEERSLIDQQTAVFIKQSRDYLFKKYLT